MLEVADLKDLAFRVYKGSMLLHGVRSIVESNSVAVNDLRAVEKTLIDVVDFLDSLQIGTIKVIQRRMKKNAWPAEEAKAK